jgi:hypothetical protein
MKPLFYLCSALLFCLGIVFYKQTPTYNPFDDVFDIDTHQLSECDTIGGMCGYFNFQIKTNKRFKPYYQIFCEDLNEVVAKGFYYEEDTIFITQRYNHYNFPDSLKNLPIDIKQFNDALNEFGYCYLNKKEYDDEINIIHKTNFDTITTSLDWHELENDSTKIVRTINYYKSKPQIIRNDNGGFIK